MDDIHIEEYYRRYAPMVLRRCRILLCDEEASLDAMQEVFVRVLSSRERLRHEYPSSLLFRIATNVCLNILRSQKVRNQTQDGGLLDQIAHYDESEKRLIFSDLLDRVFQRNKASTREIAIMHFLYGLTLNEVAELVGLSLSGVRKRINLLRQQLQAHFPEEVHHETRINQ